MMKQRILVGSCLLIASLAAAGPISSVSVNLGAQAVLSLVFQRVHVPVNVTFAASPDWSIIVGLHPTIPVGEALYGAGFGTSCRFRRHFGQPTVWRPWAEIGVWGISQENKLGVRPRATYVEKQGDPMAGINCCLGYKYRPKTGHLLGQIFVGGAFPAVTFRNSKAEAFGPPFTWSGLELGYAF
jgi:hypothetical protein